MKVLITGGAGYLGSLMSSYLIETGMRVIVYDKLIYGGEGLLSLLTHPGFELVIGDIRDVTTLKGEVKKADAIVHLAALVGEEACQVDPKATLAINTEATKKLVKMAIESGVKRIIFSSTCSNYGLLDANTVADEDSELNPSSLYAQTKVDGERSILEASDRQFSACVLRFGTICGLSPRMRFNLLVNSIARSAALGKRMSIFAPESWRPLLHIRDAVEVIYHCLTAPSSLITNQIFNVVGENCQKRQLAQLVTKHFPRVSVVIKKGKVDPRDYRVSAHRIAKKLNFHARHTIEEAFIEVAYAVENGILTDPLRAIYEALPDIKQLND